MGNTGSRVDLGEDIVVLGNEDQILRRLEDLCVVKNIEHPPHVLEVIRNRIMATQLLQHYNTAPAENSVYTSMLSDSEGGSSDSSVKNGGRSPFLSVAKIPNNPLKSSRRSSKTEGENRLSPPLANSNSRIASSSRILQSPGNFIKKFGSIPANILTELQTLSASPDAKTSKSREEAIQSARAFLENRLNSAGLESAVMRDDGNCQFRAAAYNLFGVEDRHAEVRAQVVLHMRKQKDDYLPFFGGVLAEFEEYLTDMAKNGTWGDELCLRAIADSFNCTAHTLTSEQANFYLKYTPPLYSKKHLFFTYISPIHYNAITIKKSKLSHIQNNIIDGIVASGESIKGVVVRDK